MAITINMNRKKFISYIDPRYLKGIAHRGYHNNDYTENGINAFKNAIKHDLAFEFDIHLTKDKKLVVVHDEDLFRTTGVHGIVEDMTLEEIKKIHLIDGSEIMTFEEVLALNNEKVPMVIELKVFRRNYRELVKYAKPIIKTIKDKSKAMLISFDPRALVRVRNLGFRTSFLVAESHKYTFMFRGLFNSIDIEQTLLKYPKYQRYTKKHFTNVWTIESIEEYNKVKDFVDTITYQYIDYKEVEKSLSRK